MEIQKSVISPSGRPMAVGDGCWRWLLASWSPTVLDRSSLVFLGSIVGGGTGDALFGRLIAAEQGRTAWLMSGLTDVRLCGVVPCCIHRQLMGVPAILRPADPARHRAVPCLSRVDAVRLRDQSAAANYGSLR
ncbi:MAG: hypothetical protein GY768_08620 [Planctomycetaceae bacterium]|nr:hypothetical protein [Planctomycetaceae bacterium]